LIFRSNPTSQKDLGSKAKLHIQYGKTATFVRLEVLPNLEMALRDLRLKGADRAVWADQLCIDQKYHLT
jgi:hypothetical protein